MNNRWPLCLSNYLYIIFIKIRWFSGECSASRIIIDNLCANGIAVACGKHWDGGEKIERVCISSVFGNIFGGIFVCECIECEPIYMYCMYRKKKAYSTRSTKTKIALNNSVLRCCSFNLWHLTRFLNIPSIFSLSRSHNLHLRFNFTCRIIINLMFFPPSFSLNRIWTVISQSISVNVHMLMCIWVIN